MTVAEILLNLSAIAPERWAAKWDRVGLQIGNPSAQVTSATIALDPSLSAIEFARAKSSQLLLTHHPILFTPVSTILDADATGRRLAAAIRANLNVIAAHTNWDVAPGGVNDTLASKLSLVRIASFPCSGDPTDPPDGELGRIGELKSQLSAADFAKHVSQALGTTCRLWGPEQSKITKVAVIGGVGDSEWRSALHSGASILVTGEVKHHHALDAVEAGLMMLEAGHFETEQPGMIALQQQMQSLCPRVSWNCFTPEPGQSNSPTHFGPR